MERATQGILYLSLWLSFIQLLLNLGDTMPDGTKLSTNDPNPDFISIDCGASNEYSDIQTDILYETDTKYVETGTNAVVAPGVNLDYFYFGKLLETLRSFPEGKRNCYTLTPKQGKNNNYLIRAYYAYGNYDGKNQTSAFDLYIGVTYWETVNLGGHGYYLGEIIHTPPTDTIHVCLVNKGTGIPFISALELRPLSNNIYKTPTPSHSLLVLQGRFDVGSNTLAWHSRYKDDIYDRLWRSDKDEQQLYGWTPFHRSVDIDQGRTDDSYKLPAQVLKSAAQSFNLSYALNFDYNSIWKALDPSSDYYVYMHFAEIEQFRPGQKRVIDITVNDNNIRPQPIFLEYLKPQTVVAQTTSQDNVRFSISATSESDAPPILNAFEVYKLISPLSSPTDQRDVDAILDIKNTYNISKLDWQGDPCVPKEYAWKGLNCSSGINDFEARITSLNLRTSKLAGHIATSFSQLTELESLDLSGNNLSGSLPEFLAELPKLRILNLTGNKFTGSIPKPLKEKSDLQLSVADNPGLCLTDPCEKHEFVIPLVASISVLIVVLLICLGIWIIKTKMLKEDSTKSFKKQSLELKNRAFSYSQVVKITDNLQNLIGEGGFGKVYLGRLNDTRVAVKLLSQSSKQGDREFRSEVRLLMVVHHRHLVSLIGYCEEGGMRALIYEYMTNGDVRQHLSGEKPDVLKWNERLQIALDAAYGLDYLHNGCKPPIVHGDLKTSNILLNENMEAKVADFGLSRAFSNDNDSHVSVTTPAGTPGYVDPEFQTSGNITKRSDIYSFGIILLELITGKPPIRRDPDGISNIHIVQWVTPKLQRGDIQSIVDPRLQGKYNANSAWRFLEIAMSCTPRFAVQRPDISHVVAELKECVAMEITMERTKGNTNSIQFDSEFMPSAR